MSRVTLWIVSSVVVALAIAGSASIAIQRVARAAEAVIEDQTEDIVAVESLIVTSERSSRKARSLLLTGEPRFTQEYRQTQRRFEALLAQLRSRLVDEPTPARSLARVEAAAHLAQEQLSALVVARVQGLSTEAAARRLMTQVQPLRDELDIALADLLRVKRVALEEAKAEARRKTAFAIQLLQWTAGLGTLVIFLIALVLARTFFVVESQRERLQRSTQFQEQLIDIVSHDIRSPVAAIVVSAETLRRRGDGAFGEHKSARSLDRIARSARRIDLLAGVLADFTRTLTSGLSISPDPVDLHQLVAQTVENEQAQRGRRLTLLHTSEGDGNGRFDPERISQLLIYLIDHAARIDADARQVHITTRGAGTNVEIEVVSDAEVLSAEAIHALFEPFRQDLGHYETVRFSTGLGLYLVRAIAQAHGGDVRVASSQGVGTCFTVVLPRRPPRLVAQAALSRTHLPTRQPLVSEPA